MEKLQIENILNLSKLESESELEKAISLHNKLRRLIKENPALVKQKNHLKELISTYEEEHWKSEDEITEEQIKESDKAELLMEYENTFLQKRKELIKERLTQFGLNQSHLAKILGHRKNYMSELMNGVRPFSLTDIIVIHRLLKINLKNLIFPILKEDAANRLKSTLAELQKPKLQLTSKDLKKVVME